MSGADQILRLLQPFVIFRTGLLIDAAELRQHRLGGAVDRAVAGHEERQRRAGRQRLGSQSVLRGRQLGRIDTVYLFRAFEIRIVHRVLDENF